MILKILCCFTLILSGCSSMSGKNQKLKLTSDPEGAEVYFEDEKIGNTPGFFEVPRQKSADLKIYKGNETRSINIKSSYRWGDSFLANFVWFFWFAPVGWIVDLATGAAWNYEPVAPISLTDHPYSNVLSFPEGKRKFSIAPPTSNYNLLSEEIGRDVEVQLKKRFPKDEVQSYDNTSNTFNNYGYNYANRIPEFARDALYADLGSNQIAESELNRKADSVEIKTTLTDEFSGKKWDEFTFEVPNSALKTSHRSKYVEFFSKILDVIPNTFSYGFKTPSVIVGAPMDFPNPYFASIDSTRGILSYLSALGFKNVRNPKLVPELRPYFRFTPSIVADYTRVKFRRETNNDLYGIGFDWYLLLVGIGPEVGLESKTGYGYIQFIPNFGASYIHSEGKNRYYDNFSANFALEIELGYVFFVSDRINLRLYVNGTSGFNQAWANAMSYMTDSLTPISSASVGIAGLAVGYYFPESSNKVRGWVF